MCVIPRESERYAELIYLLNFGTLIKGSVEFFFYTLMLKI